jgi:hypothetical protein
MLNNNKHHNIHLQRAWNKYGSEFFEFFIIEECEGAHELLLERENFHIRANRESGQRLFNLGDAEGGSFWLYKTEEERREIGRRISEGVTRAHKNDPGIIQRMADAKRGKPLPQSGRDKLSAHWSGVPKSDETRARMSAFQKVRAQGEDVKANMAAVGKNRAGKTPFNAITYTYNEMVFPSGSAACRALNLTGRQLKKMVDSGAIIKNGQGLTPSTAKPIIIDGAFYKSKTHARTSLHIDDAQIESLIKQGLAYYE